MAKIGYSIDYSDYERFTKEVTASISQGRWKRFLKEASEIAYQEAMRLCPVKTGWMKGQMYVEEKANSLGFVLGNDAEYASYHEYGWVAEMVNGTPENPKFHVGKNNFNQNGGGYHPFLRPGIIKGEKYFNRKIQKWLDNLFEYGR